MRKYGKSPPPEAEKGETFKTFILKEGVVFLLVLVGLITMAVLEPIPHEAVARPADTSYVPRPEWYFLFLFESLKFFPGKWEVVGVIAVPSISLLVLLLVPFLDRIPVGGGLQIKRLVTAGAAVLALSGVVFLTYRAISATPPSITSRTELAAMGNELYHKVGCSTCHTINGEGGTFGPDLTRLKERRTLSWVHKYIEDPLTINPNSLMPGYLGPLSHEGIEAVSLHLMSLEPALPSSSPSPPSGSGTGGEEQPPPGGTAGDPVKGRDVFQRNCVFCHQTGGIARDLVGYQGSDADFQNTVRQGKDTMSAFGTDKISDQELIDILSYLRTPP